MPKNVTTHRPFRVIYTGNMGLAQEVDLVIQLLTHFSGHDDVEFYFIGGGVRRADLTDVATGGAKNVKVLDYMSKDRLSAFLAESDIGLVTLSPVLEGLALPTKTYTYLAAGLPLLTFGANHSDFEELIVPGWGRQAGRRLLHSCRHLRCHPRPIYRLRL
jgi:hypothetical protein